MTAPAQTPSPAPSPTPAAWPAAARLLARWLDRRERIDTLLEMLPRTLAGPARARCQHLVLGAVRHHGRVEAALARLVPQPPRPTTRAILAVAGFELIEAAADAEPGRVPRIGHHAVEQAKALASPAEARLVNAVVRQLAAPLAAPAPGPEAGPAELAEYFSHPLWMVRSWLAQFGPAGTRALLEWNQSPAPVHARWRGAGAPPAVLQPAPWPGFFRMTPGRWAEIEPLLESGDAYLQDPATRVPVELLAPRAGEAILDLCAAPGGKSLLIADTMAAAEGVPPGRLVAVDRPGPRMARLKANLARARGVEVAVVIADLAQPLEPRLQLRGQPTEYDGVLLDTPCSNTGVMRHRVDVKWRLQPGDFRKHPAQQLALLRAAAPRVRPGGRLVYSTCSLDAEENEQVVRAFLAGEGGAAFTLERTVVSLPWETGHDGGGAFLLRRA